MSQALLDEGVGEHLPPGGELQMDYGQVPLAPLLWIDDIINSTSSIEEARQVNYKIDCVIKQRGLSLNQDKSVCLVMGSKLKKKKHQKN